MLNVNNGSSDIKVIVGDCLKNCWSYNSPPLIADFGQLVSGNCSNSEVVGLGSPIIAPVAGMFDIGNNGTIGNMLAHLHPECNGNNVDYIMQPRIDQGERT